MTDPQYHPFNAYRAAHIHEAVCYVGDRVGFDQCADAQGHPMRKQPTKLGLGLELHHSHLEFALLNRVDADALRKDFPNLTDAEKVAAWAESDENFMWLCAKHHRGHSGAHHAAFADFMAELYVRGLIGA